MDGYSWCPSCRYWIPAKYLYSFIDEDTGKLVRICENCLEATAEDPFPVFKPKKFNYDPHREQVMCVFCESYNTEPVESEEFKDYWRCKDCGESFFINLPD